MKFSNPWIDPRIQRVRAADAQKYLLRHGWKLKPFPRSQVALFEGPLDDDGQPITQLVPVDEQGSDYVQCIITLITNLALLEDRPAVDVLNDILREATAGPDGACAAAVSSEMQREPHQSPMT